MKLTSYEIHPPRFSLGDLPLLAYDGTCVMAGDVCSLKGYNGTSVVLVATSAASFKEMDKALDAEDWEGIK